ncbi:MAG TPA: prepilin-type N-terminal cleavage/methylation domain-containing protein [Luteolibacter sp.]|nr:prepilin-type N-terminal cleavage/methylation domain-containing protein [Luteolibacter sp.]
MKTHRRLTAGGFTLVELLVVIVIVATLAGLASPVVLKKLKEGDRIQAISNSREIYKALFTFKNDYQSFPDKTTFQAVKDATESKILQTQGNFSNDYFRQLLAADLGNEKIFYAKAAGIKKPDNAFNTAANALQAGEVGFGYVLDKGVSLDDSNTDRPIFVAPLVRGSAELFDAGPFSGKAVFLLLDGSVDEKTITKSKKIAMGGGKFLLQNGEGTVWGTEVTPKIAPPKVAAVVETPDSPDGSAPAENMNANP